MNITKIYTKLGEMQSAVTTKLEAVVERMRSDETKEAARTTPSIRPLIFIFILPTEQVELPQRRETRQEPHPACQKSRHARAGDCWNP